MHALRSRISDSICTETPFKVCTLRGTPLKRQGPRDLTAVLVPCAVLQFVLSPVLLWRSFVSTVLANVLYMIALSYYHYLSFLGYSALPFLEHTEVFLWPVAAIVLVVPFAVLAGFNPSRFTLNIYFG